MKKSSTKKMNHPDLTRCETGEKSVGTLLEPIIKNVTKYNLSELKEVFTKILDDPKTHVSPQKAAGYKEDMKNIYNLGRMQMFITNVYLSAANLSTKL